MGTESTVTNNREIVTVGAKVIIHESDARDFTATVTDIQKDAIFGDSVKILEHVNRAGRWTSIHNVVRTLPTW